MNRSCGADGSCCRFGLWAVALLAAGGVALAVFGPAGCGEPGDPKTKEPVKGRAFVQNAAGDQKTDADALLNDNPASGDDKGQADDADQAEGADGSPPRVAALLDDEDEMGDAPPADDKAQRQAWRDKKFASADGSTDSTDDPTANAKPLKDPNTPPPFVDPNNPNYVPADRAAAKDFDPRQLKKIGDYCELPFMVLAGYPYPTNIYVPSGPDDPNTAEAQKHQDREIPAGVKAIDGMKVAVKGYMMPIDFENGGTNEFILTRVIPSCFYCQPPQLNDWVEVKMKGGKRVPYFPDSAIVVYGTIDVGEVQEDGFVIGLYRMEVEKVEEYIEP